jgi:hypothetical protein
MSTATKSITAALAVTLASAGAYVGTRPTTFLVTSTDGGTGCVIPDCRSRLLPSGWDPDHAPVDCLATGPYSSGGPPRWRGCSVMAAEYAVGSECLPAHCTVVAGDDPLSPR